MRAELASLGVEDGVVFPAQGALGFAPASDRFVQPAAFALPQMSEASLKDMRAKAALPPDGDVPHQALDDPKQLGAFGLQFAPSFANDEVKQAWWRQHVDSAAVMRARTSGELAKAIEQAKLSVKAFCLVTQQSAPSAAAVANSTLSTLSDTVVEPVVATCVGAAPNDATSKPVGPGDGALAPAQVCPSAVQAD